MSRRVLRVSCENAKRSLYGWGPVRILHVRDQTLQRMQVPLKRDGFNSAKR